MVRHPDGDEVADQAVRSEDAEGTVASLGDLDGELHDAAQDGIQLELGRQGQAGLEEASLAIDGARHATEGSAPGALRPRCGAAGPPRTPAPRPHALAPGNHAP